MLDFRVLEINFKSFICKLGLINYNFKAKFIKLSFC